MKTVSDEDLVLAARGGNRHAFAELVKRYSTAVRAVAFTILQDYHASEDVAQEAFIAAYKRLPTLRVASLFGRWVLKISRHQALVTARSRPGEVSLDPATGAATANGTGAERDHLLAEVMRLPEREQRLIMLRFFNGHSVDEIARITGRPVGTVTKQLSRGYARLRERLAEVMI